MTSQDYVFFLESRADIITANAWGEKEINPYGKISEYNKVHLSCIPYKWDAKTIEIENSSWQIGDRKFDIFLPKKYNEAWEKEILTYLEPRKMIQVYEVFDLPELIYFKLDIGVRLTRFYTLDMIQPILYDKLLYYFEANNQTFGRWNKLYWYS